MRPLPEPMSRKRRPRSASPPSISISPDSAELMLGSPSSATKALQLRPKSKRLPVAISSSAVPIRVYMGALAAVSSGRSADRAPALPRQLDGEARALAERAVDLDRAARLLHHARDDPQAEPEPAELARRGRPLEALEDARLVLGIDADAV